jgi:predicted esterase
MELGLRKFKLSNRVFYFFERQEKDDCKTLMGPYPLIVVLHGMGGSALEYAQNRTKWLDFAKRECFSVVFPQALPSPFLNVTVWGGQGHSSLPTQHIRKVEGDDVTNANRKKGSLLSSLFCDR